MTACLLGVTSFFTIAVGGLAVGMLVGLATALITKHTKEVRVVEPLAVMIMAYLAYMVAELLHWSGILSLVGCGIGKESTNSPPPSVPPSHWSSSNQTWLSLVKRIILVLLFHTIKKQLGHSKTQGSFLVPRWFCMAKG